jgi:hypothetical protein
MARDNFVNVQRARRCGGEKSEAEDWKEMAHRDDESPRESIQ